jgi:hypothetical protein
MNEGSCLFISKNSEFVLESLANSSKRGHWKRKSPVYEAAHSDVCAFLLRSPVKLKCY